MEAIQPIVLVGGRSTRFGRDKLREPLVNILVIGKHNRSHATVKHLLAQIKQTGGLAHAGQPSD